MHLPSPLIQTAVDEISKLPGIGKKTALRLVLHLLKEDADCSRSLVTAITELKENTRYCSKCHNISQQNLCEVCKGINKDQTTICVVETISDLLAIENTGQYGGVYHVLEGIISPMEGVGSEDINISTLIERVKEDDIQEVIFALSPTMEGDTTIFYISKKIRALGVKTTTIARGVPIGGELEYTDEITLGRSILTRTNFENS